MGYAADVKALTADIARLTAEINKMHVAVSITGKDMPTIFSAVKQALGVGQKGLGSTGGNRMQSSFGNVPNVPTQPSMDGGGQGGKGTTGNTEKVPNGGGASFNGVAVAAYGQMGKVGLISTGIQAAATIGSTLYNMAPDASGVVNRAGSYYQAALRSPGMGRAGLERATFSALRGGITSIGSDAAVANTLANAGYVPGSVDYLAAARQVRGAATYLGMNNQNAANAIAGLQGGPMSANLYQYGITTMDMKGNAKSVGSIAQQLYQTMFPNGATAASVQKSIRSGYAGINLQGMGMSADQQQMITQAFIDIAAGKNPDLASAKSAQGNQNPFDPLYRMNTSSTMIQGASEKNVISGLGAAAGTIETFNNSMKDAIASMALFKSYMDGLSGNPQGSALKKGVGSIFGAVRKVVGGAMMVGGALTLDPLLALGGVAVAGGGGTPGFGSSFGGRNMRSGRGANSLISAGYGARDAQGGTWDSTGGVHKGTDYAVSAGTPVVAVKDGVVSNATLSADYGQAVIVDHDGGYSTIYAHLSNKEVSPGTRIIRGQEIGKSGKSGNAAEPHLHYEVWHGNNNPVDPSELKGAGIPIIGGAGTVQSMGIGSASIGGITDINAVLNNASGSGAVNPNAGSVGDQEFAKALLAKAGIAATDSSITALTTWMHWEGGTKNNSFNPLNTTLDMPGAGLFNKEGVKTYSSLAQGVDATYSTLTGKDAAGRGYTTILNDLKAGAPLNQVVADINNSSWGTHIKGGGTPGAPGMPDPNPSSGMSNGASVSTGSMQSGGGKVVNFHVYLSDVSDAQALVWAKKIEAHLNDKNEVSVMGGM